MGDGCRLPDGSVDESFKPKGGPASDWYVDIYTLALQADGKILMGGYFKTVDSAPMLNLARLNTDGTRDSTFQVKTGASGPVFDFGQDASTRFVATATASGVRTSVAVAGAIRQREPPLAPEQLPRLRENLGSEYVVTGIRTNLAFHEKLFQHPCSPGKLQVINDRLACRAGAACAIMHIGQALEIPRAFVDLESIGVLHHGAIGQHEMVGMTNQLFAAVEQGHQPHHQHTGKHAAAPVELLLKLQLGAFLGLLRPAMLGGITCPGERFTLAV